MKKEITLTFFLFVLPFLTFSQDATPISNGVGFGFQLNQFHRDFGMGLTFTSPYFLKNSMAVRMRGNLMWNEHELDGESTWSPYFNTTLGFVGGAGIVRDFIRLYGEGGIIALFPNEDFSSDSAVFGGYGLFGFEFYMTHRNSYFIEIGGVGTGAKADKIPSKPIYSNGLLLSVGYRNVF